jgi:Uma2 family endonuclease
MSASAETKPNVVEVPAPAVLRGVRYGTYLALRNEPANDGLRMTYYDGTLEIMSPELIHEMPSHRISTFMAVLSEELDIAIQGAGSTTFKRGEKRAKQGKAPDQCFYFANAERIVHNQRINLDRDPPPDLWVEVDYRSSASGRSPLYAALGVPEVWQLRATSNRLRFLRLADDRTKYEPIERSLSLPMLTPALVLEALALGEGQLESSWIKALRGWVRAKSQAGEG